MVRVATLGIKASHHHLGVLPSMTPAMVSESQARPRLFCTSGMRTNSAGGPAMIIAAVGLLPAGLCALGGAAIGVVTISAISVLLSPLDVRLRRGRALHVARSCLRG